MKVIVPKEMDLNGGKWRKLIPVANPKVMGGLWLFRGPV